jgi:hypothetical protein
MEYSWAVQTVNEVADSKARINALYYYAALEYVAIIYVNAY